MSIRARVTHGNYTIVFSVACALLLAACGSSSKSAKSGSSTTSSTSGTASTSAPTAASSPTTVGPASAAALVPKACSAIPVSLISRYTGSVATTRSFTAAPGAVSCEFANATATSIAIVNIGTGTSASFATFKAASSGGGRTITPISGLGSTAFSISKNGIVGGVGVLTSQGVLYSVSTNLTVTQDEGLIRQLMTVS